MKGYTYESLFPSDFYLYQVENVGASQVWSGNDWNTVFFQNAGLINLKITILAVPQSDQWSYTNWSFYTSNYVPNFLKTITIPTSYIQSSQAFELQQAQTAWQQQMVSLQKQQQANDRQWQNQSQVDNDRNLDLTFFILFFAAFDIALMVYDHSVEENKAKHRKKNDNY